MNGDDALRRFLTTDPADVGCDEAMRHLHAYVELVAAGHDPDERFPGITVHLRACSPCGADYEGLLALVRAEDENA